MKRAIAFSLLLLPGLAHATPTISSVSGNLTTNSQVVVTGTSFDIRQATNSKPIVYWDGQTGTSSVDSTISSNNWTRTQSVGIATSADDRVSGIRVSISSGSFTSTTGTDHGTYNFAYATTRPASPDYGKRYYIGCWRKEGYTLTSSKNLKFWRAWADNLDTASATSKYPDFYIGHSVGETSSNQLMYVERQDPFLDPQNHTFITYSVSNTWRYHELILKMSSAVDAQDGVLLWKVDNATKKNITNWAVSDADNDVGTPSREFDFQENFSNYSAGDIDGSAYRSDMILDQGWNRVVIGDASPYTACTHLEYQPYTQWKSTSVVLSFRPGTFSTGTAVYMYVIDNDNNASSGQQLTIGNVPPPPPPYPAITAVSGSLTQGQSIVITGTDFSTKTRAKPVVWAPFEESSINPDSVLSASTTWRTSPFNSVQYASYTAISSTCFSGTGCEEAANNWESGNSDGFTEVGITIEGGTPGATYYTSWYNWSDAMDNSTDNWKPFRVWTDSTTVGLERPNYYLGTQTDGTKISYVETYPCCSWEDINSSLRQYWSTYIWPRTTWDQTEYMMVLSSGVGAQNGAYKIYQNGGLVGSITNWQVNNSTGTGWINSFHYQMDPSNFTVPHGRHFRRDEIYLDSCFNRVFVSTQSSYGNGGTWYALQPATAWSDTSITINFNKSWFPNGTNVYFYVADKNNTVSNAYGPLLVGTGGSGGTRVLTSACGKCR